MKTTFNDALGSVITAEEAAFLELLNLKEYEIIGRLLTSNPAFTISKDRFDALVDKGMIIRIGQGYDIRTNLVVGPSYLDLKTNTVEDTDSKFEEFLSIYPKKEGTRALHNLKSKCKAKYKQYLIDKKSRYNHGQIIAITTSYVSHKDNMDKLYSSTKNHEYWIESYPLLSTFVNNLEDKLDQYVELTTEAKESVREMKLL